MVLNPHELLDKWIKEGHQVIAAPRGVDHFGIPYAQLYGDCVRVPHIKKVIFNEPATIVIWSDGTKTVVKCGENDIYDPEKGLAMAIAKKALGNKGNYFHDIKKWTEPWYEENEKKFAKEASDWPSSNLINGLAIAKDVIDKLRATFDTTQKVEKTCSTCKYEPKPPCAEPCVDCAMNHHALHRSNLEPKDKCQ